MHVFTCGWIFGVGVVPPNTIDFLDFQYVKRLSVGVPVWDQ